MVEHFDTLADPDGSDRPRAPCDAFEAESDASFPVRVLGTALLTGLGGMLLVLAVRAVTRRRLPRRARSSVAAVQRSLAAEVGARVLLGAAGVVGAHLASDVLLPALTRRLAAENVPPEPRASFRS